MKNEHIKMIEYIKNEMKHLPFVLALLVLFCGIAVYALTPLFNSSEVKYNNKTSIIKQDNVQGAIDELYACASDYAAYNTRLSAVETNKADKTSMTGATADTAGTSGLVPAPAAGKQSSFLRGDGSWVVPTDTTYSAASGGGLSLSSNAFSIADSGATAGSYGNSSNQTPAYGATFNVPYITVNAKGQVTAISNKTVKIPASDNTNTTYSAASGGGLSLSSNAFSIANSGVTAGSYGPSANATPGYGSTFNVPYITVDAKGRITAASTKTVKIPASDNTNTTYSAASGGGLSLSSNAFSIANSGVTAGSYGPSANATPGYGSTFNVPYITVDAKGRITAASTKTVKIPASDNTNTTYSAATQSAAGLMSAADKKKLDGVATGATKFAFVSGLGQQTVSGNPELYSTSALRLKGASGVHFLSGNSYVDGYNSAGNAWSTFRGAAFTVQSSKLVKENIHPITEKEAEKVLELNPVSFDYKEKFGGQKDQYGLIAEEVEKIIPSAVDIPDGYDESKFDESKGLDQPIKSIDYSKLVPYLIKMVQLQQEEINELKEIIAKNN